MVAAAPLGDIVQQHRDIQDAAVFEAGQDARCQRVIGRQIAALDLAEQADGADRMFVHRVMVIHVKLHLPADLAEIGHEAAEHARLVHPAQHGFGVAPPGQHIEEGGVGAFGLARFGMDQRRVAADDAEGFGVDFQPLALRQGKDFHQPHRILAEPVVIGRAQLAAAQGVAFDLARAAETLEQAFTLFALCRLLAHLRQEHAGQIADMLGLQEIELHEAFDRAFARPVGIAHPARDFALQVECQPVLPALGERVEVATHRQQEAFGTAEAAIFLRREQALVHQFGGAAHAVDIFADPVERLQIAQPALAVFHIGFDDIARIAHALVPRVAFGQFFGDELRL